MRYLWFSLSILVFVLLAGFLIWSKIHNYDNSPSALIGIWEGFAEINPEIVEPDFVVFKDGGYDGQFFYFIAKSLFSDLKWDLILDSYFFRLHRIGFTLFVGIPSAIIGFKYYPIVAVLLPLILFIYSVICLYRLLPETKKWYSLFYLFSPYSMNSHLLLVADGFFSSLVIITIYSVWNRSHWLVFFITITLAIFTRELGIIFAIPILYLYLKEKNLKKVVLISVPIIAFLIFWIWTRFYSPPHLGTNPLGFRDMTDLPLVGFYKSFFDLGVFHLSVKESIKILLLFQWLVLSLFLIFVIQKSKTLLIKDNMLIKNETIILFPILVSLCIIFIAEEGYWRSFDNLSRMFTLSLPLTVLYHSKNKSRLLTIFHISSVFLFIFLIIRIVFITKSKGFYLSP